MTTTITAAEWQRAIEDALKPLGSVDTGWKSVWEMVDELGVAEGSVRSALQRLHREGRLESRREPRINMTGAISSIPVYRIKQA